jgi:polysaccharide export outer membrane protein
LTIRKFASLVALSGLLAAAGCTNPIMPVSGPESWDIRGHNQPSGSLPYALVQLNPEVMQVLAAYPPGIAGAFTDRRAAETIKFGIGDTVSVTIFEAAAGGLFIPSEAGVRPGNFVQLPNQHVDPKGNITVPYAGAIRALDRTPAEVQQSIVDALRNRAIEPQVVVSLAEQKTSLVSVIGQVNQAGRYPVSAEGERILDAIAQGGGPKLEGYDTWVMLERNGKRATVPFGKLVYAPANNIYVRPNDTIYLYGQPQTFLALGAFGHVSQFNTLQSQVNFNDWRISLAEAVAKSGGLNDTIADPASVFVYRGIVRKEAERLGIDVSKFKGPIIPVVFNVNLRDPAGYFYATTFEMHNKDVLFAANAIAVEQGKIMDYIRLVTATIDDPILAARDALQLRNLIKASLRL